MKTKTRQRKKSAAPAARGPRVFVVLKVYPHVLQVERDGIEQPGLRVLNPTEAQVQEAREQWAGLAGYSVSVELLDAQGRPRS